MILETLPYSLIHLNNLKTILSNNTSHIFYKTLKNNLENKEIYMTSAAVVYIVKGRQIISDQNGTQAVLEENSLSFFSRDMYWVSDYIAKNGSFEAYLFFIDDNIIDKFIASTYVDHNNKNFNNKPSSSLYAFKANSQITHYINSLSEVYSQSENSEALLEIKLLELLHLISIRDRSYDFLRTLTYFKQPERKRDIERFMSDYYLRNLKVADYALLTGRSTATFIREFKKIYRKTPNQWLIDKRLEKAHELLIDQKYNVTDVAFEIGYENVSHFIKSYKKKFGITPKQSQVGICVNS